MANFVNPKKIKGQDKMNRIKDLMGKLDPINESKSLSELELVKKGPNGIVYGIIRENRDYFIKTSDKTSGNFMSEDFNYVGGLKNKGSEKYKSYADALKHLNLKFDMLNESFGIEGNTNLFETDGVAFGGGAGFGFVLPEETKENEIEVIEDQKSVIKVDAPPVPEAPVEDEVDIDMSDEGEDIDFEAEETEVDDDDEGDSYTKKIQKLTGKAAQMLRDKDEPDAELDKYVINSIISAINWEDIPDEDVEDIIAKIEGEDEEDGELEGGDEEVVDIDMDVEGEEPTDEIAESEEKDKEEHEDLDDEEDEEDKDELSNEGLEERLKHHEDAIANIKKEIEDLSTDEEEDKKDKDEEEKEKQNESRTFSKKQLMESFLKKNANLALKKVLKENQTICEECLGEGCPSCEGLEEALNITNQQAALDGDNVGFAPQPFGEQEVDIATAIATGQDYLHATGDLDRDGDQIPNRIDMDNNSDGELDFETFDNGEDFIEIDIESILGNSPAPAEPTTKPGTKPTTRPGKGKPRWKNIPRPSVDPRPKALKERKKATIKRNGMYR